MRRLLIAGFLVACSSKAPPAPNTPPPPAPVDAAIANVATGPDASTTCAGPPPTADAVCVQDCGEPVVRAGDPPPGWSWLSPDLAENRRRYGCPICLPADARIATPDGDVAVSSLVPGAAVISLDEHGGRITARVDVVSSVPVSHHTLVRITLDDGRRVAASAGHPLADGRALGSLAAGDELGAADVVSVDTVPYAGTRTWDLLVSGPTGLYLADGVPLASTLHR